MPEYTIEEVVRITVEAPDAQTALNTWLNVGDECATGYVVQERYIEDADGNLCEVEGS